MLIEHEGRRPVVDPSAWVAPTAVLSGDVRVGRDCRVLFGAIVTDDGGPVELDAQVIVMENAVIRGRARHPVRIGKHVIIGPHAHINGAVVEDDAFVATGASIFPGAHVGARAEVRINAIVHVNTRLDEDAVVPMNWIAAGDPAEILSADRHDVIWPIVRSLDFPQTTFGLPRETPRLLDEATRQYAELFGTHRDDRVMQDAFSLDPRDNQ